jgi:hypothetical protein
MTFMPRETRMAAPVSFIRWLCGTPHSLSHVPPKNLAHQAGVPNKIDIQRLPLRRDHGEFPAIIGREENTGSDDRRSNCIGVGRSGKCRHQDVGIVPHRLPLELGRRLYPFLAPQYRQLGDPKWRFDGPQRPGRMLAPRDNQREAFQVRAIGYGASIFRRYLDNIIDREHQVKLLVPVHLVVELKGDNGAGSCDERSENIYRRKNLKQRHCSPFAA